jgi:hypothetical protein
VAEELGAAVLNKDTVRTACFHRLSSITSLPAALSELQFCRREPEFKPPLDTHIGKVPGDFEEPILKISMSIASGIQAVQHGTKLRDRDLAASATRKLYLVSARCPD